MTSRACRRARISSLSSTAYMLRRMPSVFTGSGSRRPDDRAVADSLARRRPATGASVVLAAPTGADDRASHPRLSCSRDAVAASTRCAADSAVELGLGVRTTADDEDAPIDHRDRRVARALKRHRASRLEAAGGRVISSADARVRSVPPILSRGESRPPVTRTRPSASTAVAAPYRGDSVGPTKRNAPSTGSYSSAVANALLPRGSLPPTKRTEPSSRRTALVTSRCGSSGAPVGANVSVADRRAAPRPPHARRCRPSRSRPGHGHPRGAWTSAGLRASTWHRALRSLPCPARRWQPNCCRAGARGRPRAWSR